MFVTRRNILYLVILQALVNISNESPTGQLIEEVDESDIEKVISKKAAEEKITTEKVAEIKNYNDTKHIDGSIEQTIKKLEKDKNELYKRINKAIDESVLLLEFTNDTEAKLGINFMKDLKDQIKEINGTDSKIPAEDEDPSQRRIMAPPKKKVKLSYEEIAKLFEGKTTTVKADKDQLNENDLEIKKKLDDWILQRQLEKKKILDFKVKSKGHGKPENCGRYGMGKKKLNNKNGGPNRKQYLPCCRKCCKNSYMGCL